MDETFTPARWLQGSKLPPHRSFPSGASPERYAASLLSTRTRSSASNTPRLSSADGNHAVKILQHGQADSSAQPTPQKNSAAYCISSLIEIPPSFNMGVTNSARYNQIWGMSMAMSSAISKVSEKLEGKKEKRQGLNAVRDLPCKANLHFKNLLLQKWGEKRVERKENHKGNKKIYCHLRLAVLQNCPELISLCGHVESIHVEEASPSIKPADPARTAPFTTTLIFQ